MREARISVVNTRRAGGQREAGDAILACARSRIEEVTASGPDLILLSELFANNPDGDMAEAAAAAAETLDGGISREMSALARKHSAYTAFSLLRRDGNRLYNSIVLMGRDRTVRLDLRQGRPRRVRDDGVGRDPRRRSVRIPVRLRHGRRRHLL